jgi:glycosyltransferase involved in cell wall biosynthesis
VTPSSGLLLVSTVPIVREHGVWVTETQAVNGIRRWAEHFAPLTITLPEYRERRLAPNIDAWSELSEVLDATGARIVALPPAYRLSEYLAHRGRVRKLLAGLIEQHRFLCFASIGPVGCWGNDAGAMARTMRRPYAVWTDSVVHEFIRPTGPGMRPALKAIVARTIAAASERRVIRGAAVAIFNGQTVRDAYARHARHAEVAHDVHLGPGDAISDEALQTRLARAGIDRPVHIGYAGRVHPIKGPIQWVDAVARALESLGPGSLRATWIGDGPLIDEARDRVRSRGLEAVIRFPGFSGDRETVLRAMREFDLFLYCHLTRESPRCLIEALICGVPLLGYDSPYARGLIEGRGGGEFVATGDVAALATLIGRVAGDREQLSRLTEQAARSRSVFSDVAVFRRRADLIRRYLP